MPNLHGNNDVKLESASWSLVQTNLWGLKPSWIVVFHAPGADRQVGKPQVFDFLLCHD